MIYAQSTNPLLQLSFLSFYQVAGASGTFKLYNINGAPTGNEKALHESIVLISGVGHFVAQVKHNEFNSALEKIIDERI